MYNRYIPGADGYTRVTVEEGQRTAPRAEAGQRKTPGARFASKNVLGEEDKNAGIAGILKSLHLEELDSGDILLLLIILFLFLEGDNIETVITLGLMLLLGLGGEKNEAQKE